MRKKSSHKGENGKVLVIGGSKDYSGAPLLAGLACLRLGADLVTIACPEKVAWAISSLSPDLITVKLKGDYINSKHKKILLKLIEKNDVVLIGPGLSEKNNIFIKNLIKSIKKPKVIDADAIKAIGIQDVQNSVITPHKEEYTNLFYRSSNLDLNDNIILLKGKEDLIISKNKKIKNKTGNEGMTVGGTGDILAGLVAGYISQGISLFNSAKKAAKLNGKIGDKLKKELRYGFITSDFLKLIAKEAKK